jgi:hypothetical protein
MRFDIPEHDILHNHRRENLKSCMFKYNMQSYMGSLSHFTQFLTEPHTLNVAYSQDSFIVRRNKTRISVQICC